MEHRCLAPAAQFAEPDPEKPKPRAERWFARYGSMPAELAAGLKAATDVPVDVDPTFSWRMVR